MHITTNGHHPQGGGREPSPPVASMQRRLKTKARHRNDPAEASERIDPFRLALCLIVIVSVSRIHQQFGLIGALRPALLLFLFATGYAILRPAVVDWSVLTRTYPGKALLGLTGLSLLSMPFGISLGASGSFFISTYSKVLVTGLLFVVGIRTPRHLWYMAWSWVISCGIWSIMAFTVFDVESAIASKTQRLAELYMFDSNDLGLILVTGIPLTLFVIETTRAPLGKILGLVCLGGIGATLAITGSRGAMVGLTVVLFSILISAKHVALSKRLGFVAVVIALLAVAAPPGYWDQMQTIVAPKQDYNWTDTDGRKAVALRGVDYMKAYPVFGLGISNFPRAEGTISSKAKAHVPGTGLRWTAAHNTWIEVGSEMGVFALLLWCSIILQGTVGLWRIRKRIPKAWRRGVDDQRILNGIVFYLPSAFVGFALTSTFVSFAYIIPFYFLNGLLAATTVMLGLAKRKRSGKKGRNRVKSSLRPAPAVAFQGGRMQR